jgi:microcystin-dependent protein
MSTVKVNEVRHLSNSGTANIVLESNSNTNLQATSTLGLSVTGTLTVSGVTTLNGNTVVGNATTDTVNLISTVSGFNNFSGFTGEIRMYAGNAAGDDPPDGWLYCNGDTISQTINDGGTNLGGTHYNADGKGNDYQPLFNLLKASSDWGNSSGAAWGTDKVKVPDFRSRSPVGIATGAANAADARTTGTALAAGLTSRTLGDAVGTETHALIIAELASHTHTTTAANSPANSNITISTITADQPTHSHTWSDTSDAPSDNTSDGPNNNTTTNDSQSHNHGIYGPWISLPHFTNAGLLSGGGASGYEHYAGLINSSSQASTSGGRDANHTHDMQSHTHTMKNHTHAVSGTTSSTDPTITVSGGALGGETHTHAMTTANTGSGTAHTILSPIIAVNYIIKV